MTLSGLGIRASSSCAGGSSAVATVVTIKLNGLPVKVSVNPAPNTVLVVGLVRIVLNEQTSTTDAATGTTTITATAAHIMVAGVLDVRIAMVSTGVHNC